MNSIKGSTEDFIINLVQWLRLGVEVTGACIIGLGSLLALFLFIKSVLHKEKPNFIAIRLVLARYLALALEFQLGADILSTAIAPGWQEIGKLGAIAVIRTGLNYFLSKEMEREKASGNSEKVVQSKAGQ